MPPPLSMPPSWRGFSVPQSALLGPDAAARMQQLLDRLTAIDRAFLSQRPDAPWLYASGVRYVSETDDPYWYSAPEALLRGRADCADLAPWRAAELQARLGESARAFAVASHLPSGDVLYHVLVRRASGQVEDPSCALGMGGSCRVTW